MYSGVSGLRTHQTRMDTIGNNIANVNTYGYKSGRTAFRDIYYQTRTSASAATASRGGVNPSAVGYGSDGPYGGRPAYKIRAAIAATAGATYGVYAGYELYENVARPGSEENIDNEKYEFKFRDWDQAEADGDDEVVPAVLALRITASRTKPSSAATKSSAQPKPPVPKP